MRIVAGRLKGRRLIPPSDDSIRPTSERARQALFNILAHGPLGEAGFAGLAVLDVCAGTGAFGFEALSRGATRATFLDNGAAAVHLIEANGRALGVAEQCVVLRRDARQPGPAPLTHQLAFLDPPYDQDLAAAILTALVAAGWLASGAIVASESRGGAAQVAPAGFQPFDERRYGKARLVLLRYDPRRPTAPIC